MIYIGLDLSFTTGLIVIDEDDPFNVPANQFVTSFSPQMTDFKRIIQIADQIMQQINGIYSDKIIGIEGHSYSRFGMALLGELHGVVKYRLEQKGYEYVIYAPKSIKKFCTGAGNAKKDLMLLKVYSRWGFETDNHNIADAYAVTKLLQTHQNILKGKYTLDSLPQYQREVVENIMNEKPKWKKRNKKMDNLL